MRTTVSISDELLLAAKRRARERGQTLGAFLDGALQRELSDAPHAAAPPPVPIFRGGTGPRPGIDVSSSRALLEALDGCEVVTFDRDFARFTSVSHRRP